MNNEAKIRVHQNKSMTRRYNIKLINKGRTESC